MSLDSQLWGSMIKSVLYPEMLGQEMVIILDLIKDDEKAATYAFSGEVTDKEINKKIIEMTSWFDES